MTARASIPPGRSVASAVLTSGRPGWNAFPLAGRQLLALAMSLRARGLRGLDVLRRSRDRAPPFSRPAQVACPSPSRAPPSRDAFSPIPGEHPCPRSLRPQRQPPRHPG
jgi:hypothetical protein